MLFNSFNYILLFLPAALIFYFLANKISHTAGRAVLLILSCIFYSFAGLKCVLILAVSVLGNYVFYRIIKKAGNRQKIYLICGIVFNLVILFIFKYYNFFVSNLDKFIPGDHRLKNLFMPLGISFYTFQQIAYILEAKDKPLNNYSFLEYANYILFFPKLVMGPLMEPETFIAQLRSEDNKSFSADNIMLGLRKFNLGLIKKLLFADVFAKAVDWGFTDVYAVSSADALFIAICYTFQIYFDFSGYSDMAIGSAKMFNFDLPLNFNSPYKACTIGEYWKRWHMTLTQFFTRHLYIPLGGNRKGRMRTYLNIMIVFVVSGFWHGANWTFLIWGFIYGVLLVIDKILKEKQIKIPSFLGWLFTYSCTNILWLMFRSDNMSQWLELMRNMISLKTRVLSPGMTEPFYIPIVNSICDAFPALYNFPEFGILLFCLVAFIICMFTKNVSEREYKNNILTIIVQYIIITYCVLSLSVEAPFVYFGF